MDGNNFNHQFLCRLLNIGANLAAIEGADRTYETIFSITELVRYIYDTRKNIVLLDEEYRAVENYVRVHNMKGTGKSIALGKPGDDCRGIYISHLSIFSHIICEIESQVEENEKDSEIMYLLQCKEDSIELRKLPDNVRLAVFKIEK